jgi:general nucleoside transport system ATP-binding protein
MHRIQKLELHNITKRFPGVLANDHVQFDINAGEIHALLGENGAGKSTLMRQLYGLYQPDEGEIRINDEIQHFHSPDEAIRAGIGMVHQHFMLVPSLTVVENVALGLKSSRGPLLDLDLITPRVEQLVSKYGLLVDPRAYVWQLAVGEQQRVEIIKALYRGADLLILDEPTAVLTPREVNDLFVTLRQMTREGHSIIFISHKLHEVLAISDRVSVLRDGRSVGTRPTQGATRTELATMMVGREVILQYDRTPQKPGEVQLEVKDLWVKGDRGADALRGVSLNIHAGEILGLAGVSGNGQRELAEAIVGLRQARQGSIKLKGHEIKHQSVNHRIRSGIAFIPEERMVHGAIRDFSVEENLILLDHGHVPYSHATFLDFQAIKREATRVVNSYNVKTPGLDTPVKNLSGGNIQKLILARELSRKPVVLIAGQPTRGVDIGASEYIHQRLLEQRQEGTATLLISEDLDEIRALSDRIAVLFEGKIMGVLASESASIEKLGLMMAGSSI